MFCFLFGWPKASKCKRLVKQAQSRLKLLKNKRYAIARLLRDDVAQLIRMGDRKRALNRAEQLFRDENLMVVYELLDHFCEFIVNHMSYIRRHRELPNDINEAISSLVFASSRCGDLPELRSIRQLFGQRYGQRFLATALQLLPGNLVNCQIKEKLSAISVSDDAKSKLVGEIAREYGLRSEVLALEYTSEFQKQIRESNNAEKDRKEINSCSGDLSVAQPSPCQEQHAEADAWNETEQYKFTITDLGIGEGREKRRANGKSMPEITRSKASSHISDETVMIYPDYGIKELQGVSAKDQRVFIFRLRMSETPEHSLDELSLSEKPGSGSVSSGRARKRSRRKSSLSWENLMTKDMEFLKYYSRNGRKGLEKRRSRNQVKACYVVYNVYACPNQQHSKGSDSPGSFASSSKGTRPPYRRMKTMPSSSRERVKERCGVEFGRSNACGIMVPKHVHPKLPDYDEIAAKFMALRRERSHDKYRC